MKSSMLIAIGSALAWAALTPIMCQAQAEVSPDHFEMTNVEPFVQPTNAVTANGGSVQKQIGGGGGGNIDQRRASIFHSASLSGSKRAPTLRARIWGSECERIDRAWKQLNAKLNGVLFGEAAARFLAAWLRVSANPRP
jgi:hypothetical protein